MCCVCMLARICCAAARVNVLHTRILRIVLCGLCCAGWLHWLCCAGCVARVVLRGLCRCVSCTACWGVHVTRAVCYENVRVEIFSFVIYLSLLIPSSSCFHFIASSSLGVSQSYTTIAPAAPSNHVKYPVRGNISLM